MICSVRSRSTNACGSSAGVLTLKATLVFIDRDSARVTA
jgi:hypothetical protein